MQFHIEGVVPALLTPFTKNGARVDYDKACALAARLARQKVHAIFPCGTTGEGFLMTLEERKKLIEELVAAVGGKIVVIAHTGTLDTRSTIELTRHAMERGAHCAGVVAPGFYSYDRASLLAHFRAIANAVKGFPLFLYNIPGCARNLLDPSLIVQLANELDNVVGLKDSAGIIQNLTTVLDNAPKGFRVLNGVDEYTYQALLTGACGSVTSTANVAPELFLNVFNPLKKGDIAKARAAQTKLSKVCGVFQYGRMVAYYKEGLRLRGFDPGYVRPPQRELTAAEKKDFAKALEAAEVI